ncbi:MAG: acetyl-CoA acetyltransferase [Gammaproteobacteria bacterium]|nr:MAG: acetyl-CoA acetyltransferase [Gammaproteobacteria bacterium]
MKKNLPILVGVSQSTIRPGSGDDSLSAARFMAGCARQAAMDAGAMELLDQVDAVHVVNILSEAMRDPPAEVAATLGIRPVLSEYTAIGGNSPQWLVNRVADNLVSGRSRLALLTGCEVMCSAARTRGARLDPAAVIAALETPMVGDTRLGSHPVEIDHRADLPVRVYPIIENALRARLGLSVEQQRMALGRFAESYSRVAADNPYAWFPIERSAAEAVEPSRDNRMVSFPYTKYFNAVINVDQAAAVLMTTTGTARTLGIPEDRWVYLHGGQDAHDIWFVSHRPELAESPAIAACVGDALGQAGIGLDEVSLFDLYSCFPCMPRLSQQTLGISPEDPRPMTLTGGLPYFGGPGSNYSMHAIAEAVSGCRDDPGAFALVTANGWYCTKHSAGVYSAAPPARPWSRIASDRFQAALNLPQPLEIDAEPTGSLIVEGYTVWHDREGRPETGILCGRTADGKRAWANTRPGDQDVLAAMMVEEWIGRTGRIVGRDGKINRIEF